MLIEHQIAHIADAIAGFEMLQFVIVNQAENPELAVLLAMNTCTLQRLLEHRRSLEAQCPSGRTPDAADDVAFIHRPPDRQRQLGLNYT